MFFKRLEHTPQSIIKVIQRYEGVRVLKNEKKVRIAIYLRKSKFSEKGESIGNQIELCKEYCNLHYPPNEYNVEITVYEDEGYSGGTLERAMMYIASVFAQLEREVIAERIRDNMLELSKTGRWLGGDP